MIFTYIAVPATPVFDYYVDANHQITYLAVGGSHTLLTGEYGSGGETAGATVNSSTVELAYSEVFHEDFMNELRNRVGLRMRDQIILQDAMNKTIKEDAV